ncbi:atpase asna1 [Anaeramoeba flamelloides]|uniref:ATPase ASNA1 homolog n=1 Tax=Anaeramoeba flamelloides TaxID=1746091 RepID=A0ABQ8Z9F4_9EUKA|nr:atpase asna1 [Anaeramoeba flamelloides]
MTFAPNLQNLIDNEELSWVLVGGKGGVGKTTVSSSIAVRFAEVREKVLLISTDPAHNLSDSFNQKFGKEPSLVKGYENLYAMEVDPLNSTREIVNETNNPLFETLGSALPGIDEIISFTEIMRLLTKLDYDVVVFDTAPTGHTLRLLSFPTTMNKTIEKLLSLKNLIQGAWNTVQKLFLSNEETDNDEDMLGKLNTIKKVIDGVIEQFQDQKKTTFVNVCIPEFLSLYETERLIYELFTLGIDSHNIVVNQLVIPEKLETINKIIIKEEMRQLLKNVKDEEEKQLIIKKLEKKSDKQLEVIKNCPLCFSRSKLQQNYVDEIDMLYEEFHIVKVPLHPFEIRGIDRLKNFAKILFGEFENEKEK